MTPYPWNMLTIRRLKAHDWLLYRDVRLRALADSPHAFASTVEHEQQHSEQHWAERLSSVDRSSDTLPLLAEEAGEVVGLMWSKIDTFDRETAHVFQMWVAPEARGRGVGRMLLEAGLRWARAAGARRVLLNVTEGETPARRLYERAGFEPVGELVPLRAGSAIRSQPMQLEFSAPQSARDA